MLLGGLLLARPAAASDPLPGDLVAPPPDVNIALVYNEYLTAGPFGPAHGAAVTQIPAFPITSPRCG
jgi:hypothetical protein